MLLLLISQTMLSTRPFQTLTSSRRHCSFRLAAHRRQLHQCDNIIAFRTRPAPHVSLNYLGRSSSAAAAALPPPPSSTSRAPTAPSPISEPVMAVWSALRVSPPKLRSLAAVLDINIGASSPFISPSSNWSALIKLGPGHYCRNFSSRASDVESRYSAYGGHVQDQIRTKIRSAAVIPSKQDDREIDQNGASDLVHIPKQRFGSNISSEEKRKFLINTLFDLKDSKEAVYGTLDTWVAWEENFPFVSLKKALLVLEKEQQWHRVVQIIKWMLSKGQGTTVGTYEQLIHALEKDNRAEEAHKIWVKKLSHDLHSAPWRVCELMISIYYRNNMLERLVELFKGLESYNRKPPAKSIVQKVADAYEMLGNLEEKNRVMEKYNDLLIKPSEHFKKFRRTSQKEKKRGTGKDKKLKAWNVGVVDSGPDEEFEH